MSDCSGISVVGEKHPNKYVGTQERKKNAPVYSVAQLVIRSAKRITVHSSKAVALFCRAIKMDSADLTPAASTQIRYARDDDNQSIIK